MRDTFLQAIDDLETAPDSPESLCLPFLDVFSVSGAAVSTLGDVLGSETIAASDSTAAYVDELQFDLGEGPCWDAVRQARPILVPDIKAAARAAWPAFADGIADRGVASLFAFPLMVGPIRFGAIDLYSAQPLQFGTTQTRQARAMAELVSRHVLSRALTDSVGAPATALPPRSRRLVHQATGMVLAQLNISPADALLVIQGHAFATGRSMMEVASDVVGRRLVFSASDDQGEAIE